MPKNMILILMAGLFLCFATSWTYSTDGVTQVPYYYTVSYASPGWGCGIRVSKINLDTKEITQFDTVGLCYIISSKKPIIFTRNDSDYIFASTMNCGWGKRTPVSNNCYSDYAIFNEGGNLIKNGTLLGMYILDHDLMCGNNLQLEYFFNGDSFLYRMEGIVALRPDNSIDIIPLNERDFSDSVYPEISGFRYFNKVDERNNWIFWDICFKAEYLLRIDQNQKLLLDSLLIRDKRTHTCLFALSPDQTKIYSFHFNTKLGYSYYEDGEPPILPSYIKVYRADTLVMIDSFPAPDPSIAGGYVGDDWASCDRVGDYIVYYFFESEGIEYFAPAMLFIFDTRNNQSTWLKIGWR